MTACLFATDLHGRPDRYRKLFRTVETERPEALFLGGDLLPGPLAAAGEEGSFVEDFLGPRLERLRSALGAAYPRIFAIPGNDDARCHEAGLCELERRGLWLWAESRRHRLDPFRVYGYACVPPTPFLLKDWERYDVSRFVDPGCVSPEEGRRTVPVPVAEIRHGTIEKDLARLVGEDDLERAVFLFHAPPYRSKLDRAALDGKKVDHAPLDVHVGSVAVRRFIEARQPWLTLHGHVHEAARLTGAWRERIGRTWALGGANDGPELALVRFELERPAGATRVLL